MKKASWIGIAASVLALVVLLTFVAVLTSLASASSPSPAAAQPTATQVVHTGVESSYANGYYTLRDIRQHADAIVIVTVGAQSYGTVVYPSGDLTSTVTVVQSINGGLAAGVTIRVNQLGGPNQENGDDPHLVSGERAVLFLMDMGGGLYNILMGGYGHYTSVGGKIHPALPVIPGFLGASVAATALQDGTLSESDFLAIIAGE